jgi:hypothetical protein
MLTGDPRADPAVVDLIELAGLWLAAEDRAALRRSLQRLVDLLAQHFPADSDFRARFVSLLAQASDDQASTEELRRGYRRATLG